MHGLGLHAGLFDLFGTVRFRLYNLKVYSNAYTHRVLSERIFALKIGVVKEIKSIKFNTVFIWQLL